MAAYRRHKHRCMFEWANRKEHPDKRFLCPCGSWGKKLIKINVPLDPEAINSYWGQKTLRKIRKWRKKLESRRLYKAIREWWN